VLILQVSEQVDVEQVHRHGDDPVMRRDITVQSVGIEVHRNSNAKKHLYVLNRGHEDGEEARLHFDRGKEVPQVHHRVNKGVQQGEELARCREMDEVKPGVPRGDQVMDVVKTAKCDSSLTFDTSPCDDDPPQIRNMDKDEERTSCFT